MKYFSYSQKKVFNQANCFKRNFVCVEVLRPSQPNGVMSSAVSLPNHTFTGLAKFSKRLTSIVHILSPETDNCPSWISGRERMTVENIHGQSPRKNVADLGEVEPATSCSPVGPAQIEIICMKCQIPFSGKNEKNKILSAELAQSVVRGYGT